MAELRLESMSPGSIYVQVMSIHWKELVILYLFISHEIGDILITVQEEIQLTVLCKK